jgi:hypothetical protein
MEQVIVEKSFTFTEEDLVDLICCAVEGGIGYWCRIDNSVENWKRISNSMPDDHVFEDTYLAVLKTDEGVRLLDTESDDVWYMHYADLLKGIKMAIMSGDWSGDVDDADACVGDVIFQYALFDKIVFA